MPYVEGELGKKIDSMMWIYHNPDYVNKEYTKVIDKLVDAWNLLPDDKVNYSESFLIVKFILQVAIESKNYDVMRKWVDKVLVTDLERVDSGEREMWAGRVAYQLGENDKAFEYFKTAFKKSGGRAFHDDDKTYLDFYISY